MPTNSSGSLFKQECMQPGFYAQCGSWQVLPSQTNVSCELAEGGAGIILINHFILESGVAPW